MQVSVGCSLTFSLNWLMRKIALSIGMLMITLTVSACGQKLNTGNNPVPGARENQANTSTRTANNNININQNSRELDTLNNELKSLNTDLQDHNISAQDLNIDTNLPTE